MKNLNRYGVKLLSENEINKTNGGFIWPIISLLIAAANDAVNNPDDFRAGFEATQF